MMGRKSEWGKGYAKEATKKILSYCFDEVELRKITLGVVIDNKSAFNLYKKIGFEIDFSEIGSDPESGLESMRYEINYNTDQVNPNPVLKIQQRSQIEAKSTKIGNYSVSSPSYIYTGNEYFENHPFDLEQPPKRVQRSVLRSLPTFVIVTRNSAGLETRNTVELKIPRNLLQQYLKKLESVYQQRRTNQNNTQTNFKGGNN
jgi:hypothetical protein